MRIVPIMMIKNEENYIKDVLSVLLQVFPHVFIADTGSTDNTLSIINSIAHPGIHLYEWKTNSPKELGQIRGRLAEIAQREYGFEWCFQVDGDELYYPSALRDIIQQEIPPGKRMGFTVLCTVDIKDGVMWFLDDKLSRAAIFPITDKWYGDYPFEVPESWLAGSQVFHYFDLPPYLSVHGLHLHRLPRSKQDKETYMRITKQFKFGLRDKEAIFVEPIPYWPADETRIG